MKELKKNNVLFIYIDSVVFFVTLDVLHSY